MNEDLAKSLVDFIEKQGLKHEAIYYVESCDVIELISYFER